jgi:hypothetical protein
MSHYITVPIDANGVIDPDEKIADIITKAMSPAFGSEDVFIYSHGWWTGADAALKEYNVATTDFIFSIKQSAGPFSQPPQTPFLIGIHWPSMLSDDPNALLNKLEVLSFYAMEKRADDIGEEGLYAILRLLLPAIAATGKNIRVNLFGHSFGCKVVCAAFEKLAENGVAIPANVLFNVILLEAAFATNALDKGGYYEKVLPAFGNNLRMLISHSDLDYALRDAFPAAHDLNLFAVAASKSALGYTGPSATTLAAFPTNTAVSMAWGSKFVGAVAAPPRTSTLVVADLTPIHADPQNQFDGGLSGHHSDIFLPEIYDLMSWFLFS